MEVKHIKISNCLGIEALDIKPGALTILEGRNASGKTSVLDALKAVLSGGHDPDLIRQGADAAEIVITLDDGVELRKKITAKKSTLDVIHPRHGKVSKSQAWVNEIVDSLSLDPVAFLSAPAKERVNILLQALPMRVTASDLSFLPVSLLKDRDFDQHALEILSGIRRDLYDARTGVNRAAKEKLATVAEMRQALPGEPPEGDWSRVYQDRLDGLRQLEAQMRAKVEEIREKAQKVIDRCTHDFYEAKQRRMESLEAQILELRNRTLEMVEAAQKDRDTAVSSIVQIQAAQLEEARAEYEPRQAELQRSLGEAKVMAEAAAKAEQAREYIETLKNDAEGLEKESESLTGSIDRIDRLKSELLENLPIKGVEIREGEVVVDGIPFDRVNHARRIQLAIEIGIIRAGELGLLLVDHMEALDARSWKEFQEIANGMGLQIIAARVSESELVVKAQTPEPGGAKP